MNVSIQSTKLNGDVHLAQKEEDLRQFYEKYYFW